MCVVWVNYTAIGCRHPFMKYWQPLLAKTTATCCLWHPENERQWSINSFWSCIYDNQGITRIFVYISVLLPAFIGKNTIYSRWNTDTKLIDIANCSTSKSALLVAENAILIRYYQHTSNTRALYDSMDGPAGRLADNPPISDWLGVYHGILPKWAVRVTWWPGPPTWQLFGFDLDLYQSDGAQPLLTLLFAWRGYLEGFSQIA